LGVTVDDHLLTDLQSGFDLIIVDPFESTDMTPGKHPAFEFTKSDAIHKVNKLFLPVLPKELKPFKSALIARYVALGRNIAGEHNSSRRQG
jgi:hypothetical protein